MPEGGVMDIGRRLPAWATAGRFASRMAAVALAWAGYLALFPTLFRELGAIAGAVGLAPVVLSAALFGKRGGVVAGLAVIPLRLLLFGQSPFGPVALVVGGIIFAFVGGVVGRLRDLSRDLHLGREALQRALSRERDARVLLEKREGELAAAHQVARLGSWEWDLGSGLVTWSAELCRILGVSSNGAGISRRALRKFIHPEDRAAWTRSMAQARASRSPFELEFRFVQPEGRLVVVNVWSHVLCDEGGVATKLTGIAQDVTAARALEARMHQLERLASIGTLAAGVAHEINNPASAIKANLSYVLEEAASSAMAPDVVEALRESTEAVRRIGRIVDQLKLSTRSASTEVVLKSVCLAEAVHIALRLAGPAVESATLEVEVDKELWAHADEVFVGQVIGNLVTNAVQATPPGARAHISIRAERRGERIRLEIADRGVGMDEATQRRIFEPFFTTKPVGQGTGLGLSVVRGLVASMGGRITVESKLGKGTTFCIELAAAAAGEAREDLGSADQDRGAGREARPSRTPGTATYVAVRWKEQVRRRLGRAARRGR